MGAPIYVFAREKKKYWEKYFKNEMKYKEKGGMKKSDSPRVSRSIRWLNIPIRHPQIHFERGKRVGEGNKKKFKIKKNKVILGKNT